LAESDAILVYFGEGTEYLPEDRYERAQVLQWMFFEQYSHEPNIAVLRFRAHAGIEGDERDTAVKREGGYRALEAMERHLSGREFFVSDGPSVADLALYAYTHVADEGGFEMARFAAIGAWLERVRALPGYVPITA
jgi:glutathione S-transferase